MAVTFNIPSNGGTNKTIAKMKSSASDFNTGEYSPTINAVEIDWNGAVLSDGNPSTGGATSAINQTVTLLELINSMQKEIYVLTAAVVALAQK